MNEIGMSIEYMTGVSCLLFAISGVLAVAAVIMFFALDIAKCWRMVSGRYFICKEKRQIAKRTAVADKTKAAKPEDMTTEKISRPERTVGGEKTLLLDSEGETEVLGYGAARSTVLLDGADKKDTELPDANKMEIIQDIVYIQGISIQ